MKPTFRKVYSAPGYWTEPKRLEFWPGPSHDYYSGRWNPAVDFDALFQQIYRVTRERQDRWYCVAQSTDAEAPAPTMQAVASRHKDDILRLPLGASIRADGPEYPLWPMK